MRNGLVFVCTRAYAQIMYSISLHIELNNFVQTDLVGAHLSDHVLHSFYKRYQSVENVQ
jgi:hypothetical protein